MVSKQKFFPNNACYFVCPIVSNDLELTFRVNICSNRMMLSETMDGVTKTILEELEEMYSWNVDYQVKG